MKRHHPRHSGGTRHLPRLPRYCWSVVPVLMIFLTVFLQLKQETVSSQNRNECPTFSGSLSSSNQ